MQLELYREHSKVAEVAGGYGSLTKTANGFIGRGIVTPVKGVRFQFEDQWTVSESILSVSRKVAVAGNAEGGFLSAITFSTDRNALWPDVDYFAPGVIYGGPEHIPEDGIGGMATYRSGQVEVRIREDRLPAPLFGAFFRDGTSLAVLDRSPRGNTTAAESHEAEERTLVDERFQFGALGGRERAGRLNFGFWFPGTEGEVSYVSDRKPMRWRRRYHPIRDGLSQQYQVGFRFGRDESFCEFYKRAWRWAWSTLKPVVNYYDIDTVRRSLVDMLAERVVTTHNGWTGIAEYSESTGGELPVRRSNNVALMGFAGKNIEAANFLLQEADRDLSPRGERFRTLAVAIVDSFRRLRMSPPEAEGFSLTDGHLVPDGSEKTAHITLRVLSDDFKALIKAYGRERRLGHDYPGWLEWCTEFADWLLTQQRQDGGFPRAWRPRTGEVYTSSPLSSYNPVPFLVFLSQETGQRKYLEAAIRAADFCWLAGQRRGQFVGGILGRGDIIDKEAGTLSLEAYLALYEATRDRKWLDRASTAANFAETWIYCWNVPMPDDESDAALHWKKGVSTVGLQLIASGSSGVDEYMAFDADEFAKMYVYTKDPHYLEVARILLHNTKNMLALPGRTYDLLGPGWQQEHWSLAPVRGFSSHRCWLPWVSTSHLNGIFGLEEFDPVLFKELATCKDQRPRK